jgi:DnaJ-class molecular chaperone
MAKDYYWILGVPIDAAPGLIRSAFREKAKLFHPDHVGTRRAREFQDAREAYEVLSDPVRRARYDNDLQREAASRARRVPPRSVEPEPLIGDPMPITGEPEAVRPSFEALFDRLLSNFAEGSRPKAEQAEPLDFELILSPREAGRGVVIPFQVPVLTACPVCEGSARAGAHLCEDCDGEGGIVDQRALDVRVPRGIRDGTVVEVSLDGLGVRNLWLRVHVRIAPH